MSAVCGSCGAEMLWVSLRTTEHPDGAPHPLNVAEEPGPAAGLICRNPRGGAIVLRDADLREAEGWQEKGATFHVSHFATCPGAAVLDAAREKFMNEPEWEVTATVTTRLRAPDQGAAMQALCDRLASGVPDGYQVATVDATQTAPPAGDL